MYLPVNPDVDPGVNGKRIQPGLSLRRVCVNRWYNESILLTSSFLQRTGFLRVKQSHAVMDYACSHAVVHQYMASNTNEETRSVFEFVSDSHGVKEGDENVSKSRDRHELCRQREKG